ncbi:MAG: DUF3160 domain-containing protein [Spirochaetales bacterium]|nr:DUF3160 domain-containing protein [Spirochaetales bacterium]
MAKKLFLILVLFFMVFSTPLFSQEKGDVNGDKSINIIDALLVAQYYVGIRPIVFITEAADVNSDRVINIIDALLISNYYVGIIPEFPQPDMPIEIIKFKKELQEAFGDRYIVSIKASLLTIFPPQYNVFVGSPISSLLKGELGGLDFTISLDNGSINLLESSIKPDFINLDTQPEGPFLFKGMKLWCNRFSASEIDPGLVKPMAAMGQIIITRVKSDEIRFLDSSEKAWILYKENDEVRLVPENQNSYPVPDNMDAVKKFISMSDEAEKALLNNGFVVLSDIGENKLSEVYFKLFMADYDVSTLITSDSLLHLFHMVYDNFLRTVEKKSLSSQFTDLITLMNDCVVNEYNNLDDPLLKQAAKEMWVIFTVGQALCEGKESVFDEALEPIIKEVNEYLVKIYEHRLTEFYPGDDYTLYEPRGHYAGDKILENYFRAMKWISRRIFRVHDPNDPTQSDLELRGSAIVSWLLMNIRNNMHPIWSEIYEFTSQLVDTADSITPEMVNSAMAKVFPDQYSRKGYHLIADSSNLEKLRKELLSDIYPESEIIPVPLPNPGALPKKYVQFMGERYIIDGEAMQRTCFPHVDARALPSGLDVAASVLYSSAAMEELSKEFTKYPDLKKQLSLLKEEYSLIPTVKWQRSIYNQWLYSLQPLSKPAASASPRSMKSDLWLKEKLNTQMASWTELRHDNILYAKQTMIPSPYNPGLGLVEPYPQFYSRLNDAVDKLDKILNSLDIDLRAHKMALSRLRMWLKDFGIYAQKIEEGKALSENEQSNIKSFGLNLLDFFSYEELAEEDPELVADVASSSISYQVLHQGVGKLNPLVVIYDEPDTKRTLAAIGYVMSHYEFAEENWNRLNDEEWKLKLENNPPSRPEWVQEYLVP